MLSISGEGTVLAPGEVGNYELRITNYELLATWGGYPPPMPHNPILEKSYGFAVEVVGLYQTLCGRREYVLSKQLVRAGTSIGANVEEAMAGQSRRDFLAKMSIARKEARECRYWLRLLVDSKIATAEEATPLVGQNEELIRLLTAIILSTGQASQPAGNS